MAPLCVFVPQVAPVFGADPEMKTEFQSVILDEESPKATLQLMYCDSPLKQRPAILMLGELKQDAPPAWSLDLLQEGYMLVTFQVAHPPHPDPKQRPEWLVFDQRFAHSYVQRGARAPHDAGRVIDYLISRKDIDPKKIGWMGSSSTGIPGLSVAAREPRLAAIVAFVSTGAYEQWLETWHTNKLWRGEDKQLWPETIELLKEDPIRHVEGMYPCAVLMVSGGDDKVVDPATARSFVNAARPYYAKDPERLRLVVYEGFTHNLPPDVVKLYTEHWFRTYMHPTKPAPTPSGKPANLDESVKRTQINAGEHKNINRSQTPE
jgi:dienelactone hydrolase